MPEQGEQKISAARESGARREDRGVLGRRSPLAKFVHIALWTALFYGLAVAVAKLAEWLQSG